jgi:phosphatidylglycerophosphate synthase
MKNDLLVYIPSETKAAPHIAVKKLLGVPQFLRGILTLEDTGPVRVTLVAPVSERRRVLKSWQKHIKNKNVHPHFVWTPANQKINAKIFADIVKHSADRLTILNANLICTKEVLDPWKEIALKDGYHLKAVIDRGLPPVTSFTLHDFAGMKSELDNGSLHLEDLMRLLLRKTKTHYASTRWNKPLIVMTRFTRKRDAIKLLTNEIRKNTPQWIARNINKRISLPISVVLARLRISPNTITVVNMLIGMGASIGAAGRTYVGLLIGASLFQLASIVDGCDGEVAKLTHRCTKFGQYIDSVSDNLALAGFMTGLMIHLYRVHNHTPWAFVLGGAQLLGILIVIGIMIRFLKKNTNSASFVTYDKEFLQKLPDIYPKFVIIFVKYSKYLLKKDFFSFMFLIFAIFGILPIAFYISIFVTWSGVFVLAYLNWKSRTVKGQANAPMKYSLVEDNGVRK